MPNEKTASYYMANLEPGDLYLVIMLPPARDRGPDYKPVFTQDSRVYIPDLPAEDDPNYASACLAESKVSEELRWGLYYHRGLRDGLMYTIERNPDLPDDAVPGDTHSPWRLQCRQVKQSPRLDFDVVGLVRVYKTPPDVSFNITSFLSYVTPRTGQYSLRSFVWAVSVYFKTREITLQMQKKPEISEPMAPLLEECMRFASKEAWYALGKQLPRPVLSPATAFAPLRGETAEQWVKRGLKQVKDNQGTEKGNDKGKGKAVEP